MANSKYQYVRSFEQPDNLLPNTFIVVRIDGRGFTKLTTKYGFDKPNDRRALDLMNAAAEAVMKDLPDLVLAYGQSDEFSFVFHKDCMLFERRASKLVTTIVSTFTANYVLGWAKYFADAPLTPPLPSFDGRAVCYPSNINLRDYLSWRQADCHINNLYNTTFWALVQQGGLERPAAERELSGTVSADKNEILFSRFGINYNKEPDIFRKGSVLYRDFFPTSTHSSPTLAKNHSIQHPAPQSVPRPMSQPVERIPHDIFRWSPASGASTASTPRGPTFLSTSTTPSPPPSPPSMSMPTFADAFQEKPSMGYPSSFTPISPPVNGTLHRLPFPALTPLPLPPPTLKPSTRPPPSLNPPNPIAHTNTSPVASPYPGTQFHAPNPPRNKYNSHHNVSHSASASLSLRPVNSSAGHRPPPKRSPSMSALDLKPPTIPLRISSIPHNAPPRKLSLPAQKSHSLLPSISDNVPLAYRTDGVQTPPHHQLMTMKELPSPPPFDHDTSIGLRGAVMGSEPQAWAASPDPPPTRGSSIGHGEMEGLIVNPVIPPSPPGGSGSLHSRTESPYSRPSTSYEFPEPPRSGKEDVFSGFEWASGADLQLHDFTARDSPTLPVEPGEREKEKEKERKKSKGRKKGGRRGEDVDGAGWMAGVDGNEGRPVAGSKTAKEKERKKKGKARIVLEHVDLIGDTFWERRPWILSGRTG